jgi:transcriptional regulator with XRE-family HTH domain
MMELNEKLQALRKQKGLTQEALAAALYVSRAAVSKWESGRGYPSIDSLKAIAVFFGITIDQLLSGDELLTIAEEDTREQNMRFRTVVSGLLDCSAVLFLFLPLLGQKTNGIIQSVSLLSLTAATPYLRITYWTAVIGLIAWCICTLVQKNMRHPFWDKHKYTVSLILNAVALLLFIISLQPYAAALLFVFLSIKVFLLLQQS